MSEPNNVVNLPIPVPPPTDRIAGIQPFQPSTFKEVIDLAAVLSQAAIIPSALRGKPNDVAAIVLHGASLGIDAMSAIRSMHIIEGKPTLSADLMVGLAKRSPVCEHFTLVESTDLIATYETKRRGDPRSVKMSFTIEQARAANLLGKSIWKAYPAAMLRARAASALARAVYPDIFAGVYDPDELEPTRTIDVTPPATPPDTTEVDALLARVRDAATVADLQALKADAQAVRVRHPSRSAEVREALVGKHAALTAPVVTPPAPTPPPVDPVREASMKDIDF